MSDTVVNGERRARPFKMQSEKSAVYQRLELIDAFVQLGVLVLQQRHAFVELTHLHLNDGKSHDKTATPSFLPRTTVGLAVCSLVLLKCS